MLIMTTTPHSSPDSSRARRAVPHTREFLADTQTPLGVYRRLAKTSPTRFLFESISGGEQVSRYSFLGAAPREIYRLYADRLEVEICSPGRSGSGERRVLPGEPLQALHEVLASVKSERSLVPFTGGFVGYFGFDLIRMVERLPNRPPDAFELPIALLARIDTVVVFDHAYQRVLAISNEIEGEVTVDEAERRLAELTDVLTRSGGAGSVVMPAERPSRPVDFEPTLDSETFQQNVRRAKRYITDGDIFQVVLARRWRLPRRLDPVALYRALRIVNPSPYMVLLETPDVSLAGASPEMLVRKHGHVLETRPIAGTRPRGADADGDRRLAEDLLADPKERAEHVMLVDLGRNDLGRVAQPRSVRVPTFMEIERYSHVMHIVSSVEAELAAGKDGLDAMLSCFPAGTLSGAPKIRAMEIIDELEPEARGPYGGAIGYFSYAGDVDTCITIRTLVVRGDETSVTAGAGIVADSDPLKEAEETENKAAGMMAAVALAEQLAARLQREHAEEAP